MKTILVPVDLSDVSTYGLDTAANLAKKHHATVVLLHRVAVSDIKYTVVESAFHNSKEEFYNYLTHDTRDRMRDIVENPTYQGVKFDFKIVRDDETLPETVTHQNADLIVMGSNGASGWKEWVRGSNAEHVVRDAQCPVLVIKTPVVDFKRVIFSLDFEKTDLGKHATKLLGTEGIEYFFVYVDDGMSYLNGPELKEKMGKLAMEIGMKEYNFEIFNDNTIEKGILNYANVMGADLIAMYTHGRKGFDHFMHGSIASDIINHSLLATLVYH